MLVIGAAAQAEPFLPTDDAQVVEQLPTAAGGLKGELRELRAELANNPKDVVLAVRLARRYIDLGRSEADPRYYGQAEALLQDWWSLDAPPPEVRVLRATLRQNRHEFEPALADLSAVLAAHPRDAQAWLTQAVILQVTGRHEDARRSCMHLVVLATPLVSAACLADVESVNGEAGRAQVLLRRAIDASADAEAGLRQWALTILAEIAARAGNPREAERNFRAALAIDIKDAYLLGAYADFLLDQQRPTDVRDLLADETRVDPLLLRLALAELRLGAPELAEHVAALEARFDTARSRGDTVHRREEARFALHLLGEPAAALRLALDNWAVQREAWDARLVLEAALAAGAADDAEEVLAWLQATGLEDRQIATLVDRLAKAGP